MQLADYLETKFRNLVDKASQHSVGNNKVCKVDVTTSVIYLETNENQLVEVEVKADSKNLGWVYRDDIDFLILDRRPGITMTNFKSIRQLVEQKAKENGKAYFDNPKLYHIRKDECGAAYFYLHENDIKNA